MPVLQQQRERARDPASELWRGGGWLLPTPLLPTAASPCSFPERRKEKEGATAACDVFIGVASLLPGRRCARRGWAGWRGSLAVSWRWSGLSGGRVCVWGQASFSVPNDDKSQSHPPPSVSPLTIVITDRVQYRFFVGRDGGPDLATTGPQEGRSESERLKGPRVVAAPPSPFQQPSLLLPSSSLHVGRRAGVLWDKGVHLMLREGFALQINQSRFLSRLLTNDRTRRATWCACLFWTRTTTSR